MVSGGTGYIVSSSGYVAQCFEGTGYLVLRVQGTWFRRYWGT